MINNIKGIAIQGAKGLGKDTITKEIIDFYKEKYGINLERYAFGDVLKELTIGSDENDVERFKSLYNFDYINEDILSFKNDQNGVKTKLFEILSDEEKNNINLILNKDQKTNGDKLYLIEYFKNIPSLKTRLQVQTYSDIVKKESGNIFYFSEYMVNKIKIEKGSIKNIINTDTRFIVEVLDLLLNDFILIKLKNEYLNNSFKNKKHLQHISETELGINDINIGISLDSTDYDDNNNDKFKRKSISELKQNFIDKINPKIVSFKGYSEDFKKEIKKIKNKIKRDKEYISLQETYSKLYKKYYSELNNEKIENELFKAYNKYENYSKRYLNKINSLIENELYGDIKFKNKIKNIPKKNLTLK